MGTVDGLKLDSSEEVSKVVVVGLGGVTWDDIKRVPAMSDLFSLGPVANVALRDRNYPGDIWASIGAGNRLETDLDAGRSFDAGEVVDGTIAGERYGEGDILGSRAQIIFPGIERLAIDNKHKTADGAPGALGEQLDESGSCAAALGNADSSLGPVTTVGRRVQDEKIIVDDGIHREVALAAMREDGTVASGSVSRSLLVADQDAPFGVATSHKDLVEELARVLRRCRLAFVELGETTRADAYSLGLAEEVREQDRRRALIRSVLPVRAILSSIDRDKTTLILISTSAPGGIQRRSQFHPMVVIGAGQEGAVLTSKSTRREGLLWAPDVTALIRDRLGLKQSGHSHVPTRLQRSEPLQTVSELASRAYVHDVVRPPLGLAVSAVSAVIYLFGAWMVSRGLWWRWLDLLLLATLVFPLASYVGRYWFWRGGPFLVAGVAIASTVALATLVHKIAKGPRPATATALLLTVAFFIADMVLGTPSQIDSTFGYSPISAGRFFGLGNLGFALLASSVLLAAGMVASVHHIWSALILGAAVASVGVPALGGDVGGTLALGASGAYLLFEIKTRRKPTWQTWLSIGSAALGLVAVFGIFDLLRPAESQTHLGAFLSQVSTDPSAALDVFARKIATAVAIAVGSKWGLLAPAGILVLILIERKAPRWRAIRDTEPEIGAAFRALLLAAVLGTLLNDSGVAIAGMMMGVAAPWALLMLSPPKQT